MENVPKIKDLQKEMSKAPAHKKEAMGRAQINHIYSQIREMAKSGYRGLHTEELKKLQMSSPHIVKEALEDLSKEGYTIMVTDVGHQIEWPAAEPKQAKPS